MRVEERLEATMQFLAKARYVAYSPYKLRPIADVVRSKSAKDALNWLTIYKTRRSVPVYKVIASAVANASASKGITDASLLKIKEIKVDQGPIRDYFKPGAMGRAVPQRRRYCHLTVVLESKE